MSAERRREALRQLQKAWPKGPMPTFAPEYANQPDLLPEIRGKQTDNNNKQARWLLFK